MASKIYDLNEKNDIMYFTLKGVNVSLANGLRRSMINSINSVVFRTTNHPNDKQKKNDSTFEINTTRFNNEILKQRLSCVPIYVSDVEGFPYEQYVMECHVRNETDAIIYITTKDFKIKNILTNEYISDQQRDKIFPKNSFTDEYIKYCRLRPRLSDEISGEELKMTCKFSIGNVMENSMFNVVSLCSYGNTLDVMKVNETWDKKEKDMEEAGLSKEEIEFNKKNWLAVDAKRLFEKDSFDFKVKTIGVFSNKDILRKGCKNLLNNFEKMKENLVKDMVTILDGPILNEKSYDIVIEGDGQTYGKIIESILHYRFFEKEKKITYVGFHKNHPHDQFSYIRVVLSNESENPRDDIKSMVNMAIDDAASEYNEILSQI
jgi:DNA-directed RNA polymerase subunit L